jgi:uncharacterized protein DUF3943
MWKSIFLSLLLLGIAFVVQAEQQSFPLTLASNSDDNTGSENKIDLTVGNKTSDMPISQVDNRDCNNLGYKVTLFSPCGDEDATRLWRQTKIMMVAGFGVAATIAMLPEDISGWEKGVYERGDLARQWYENVKAGPVWDNDVWVINYIGHPYFGGVYYQASRKSGYNQWNSFTYAALMSTFYWEYGLEAFAEVPSIQDLFVTPIGGWVYGEWAYNKEKEIRRNGNLAMGSEFWGGAALFFLDPIGVIDDWCCVSKKVEVTAFNITRWPAQQYSAEVNPGKDYWGIKFAVQF